MGPPSEHPVHNILSFSNFQLLTAKLPTASKIDLPIANGGTPKTQKMRFVSISRDKRLRLSVALVTLTKLRGPTARGRLVPLEVVRHPSHIGHEPREFRLRAQGANARSGESRRSLRRRRSSSPPPR